MSDVTIHYTDYEDRHETNTTPIIFSMLAIRLRSGTPKDTHIKDLSNDTSIRANKVFLQASPALRAVVILDLLTGFKPPLRYA